MVAFCLLAGGVHWYREGGGRCTAGFEKVGVRIVKSTVTALQAPNYSPHFSCSLYD